MKKKLSRRLTRFLLCLFLFSGFILPVLATESSEIAVPTNSTVIEEDTGNNSESTPNSAEQQKEINKDGGDHMTKMGNLIYKWYLIIRNNVAVPLLILSFASCGFRFLFSGFATRPGATDGAKTQMLYSALALGVLIFLPWILGAANDMFSKNAWTPPQAAHILIHTRYKPW